MCAYGKLEKEGGKGDGRTRERREKLFLVHFLCTIMCAMETTYLDKCDTRLHKLPLCQCPLSCLPLSIIQWYSLQVHLSHCFRDVIQLILAI